MKQLQILLALCVPLSLFAQPANDECSSAMELTELQSWCSGSGEFNNSSATQSIEAAARCELSGSNFRDVWFTFQAIGTDLSVRVIGQVDKDPGGTMSNPEVSVYQGSCSQLAELGCNSDAFNVGFVELLLDQITPGSNYFIRVSGRDNSSGSFQLCVNSFNSVPDPNSDCPTGVVLCDKSSFVVEALTGSGKIQDEANNSCLDNYNGFGNPPNSEESSAWYKWVAGKNGTLSFTITPSNPSDDIDFALYELPNGLQDCSDKILLRCMASGEQGGCATTVWEPCSGPTGMSVASNDNIEDPGCNVNDPCVQNPSGQDDDNFIAAIELEVGKAYGLIVNNFTQSGSGFSIDFGGTGEFLGPEADFLTDDQDGTICFGDPVTFFDQSSFGELSIKTWNWNFGEGATPQGANGVGPHRVTHTSGGVKSIALTVESETGCLVTTIGSVIVEDPFMIDPTIIHQSCPESIDGGINLDVTSGSAITSIQWDNGMTGPTLQNLPPGDYTAIITNFNGCDTLVRYTVEAPLPLEIEEIITRPSCGGGSDGSITLNVTGQAPPFLFNFNRGAGFTSSNSLNGLPAAIYQIQVQDNNGCITDVTVPLGEIDIQLDPDFNPVTPPSCFGYNDGRLEIRILGGEPPFAYKWRPNEAFRMADTLVDNVSAGTYIVEVRDGFNCLGFVHIAVPQPEELVVNIDTTNISCFGEIDGALAPLVFGGTGAYQYSWSTGVNDSVAQELPTGQYGVTVTDANGCQTLAGAFIAEPPRIDIVIDSTRDVICFGDATGSIFYRGAGGSPPFTYSIDGANFTEGLQFDNLPAGSYNLTIKDGRGCTRSVPTEIFQPAQLIVNAGNDTVVDLGFSTQLLATHQPLGKPVLHQWTPGESLSCQDCPSPIAGPLQSTTYLVTIIDDSGCTATDQVEVLVFLNRPVYVPNSFTPNGDGLNDRLTVFGGPSAQSVRKIQIYDRWGELVFEGKNLSLNDEALGWDGRHNGQLLNPGVFVYVAEIEFIDNSILEFEGDFTLLR